MLRSEIEGWKSIADHLGVGTRTAQKWEKERGLPVRRLGEGPKARVFAYADEIEEWRQAQTRPTLGPSPEVAPPRKHLRPVLVSGLIVLVAVLLLSGLREPANPESAELAGTQLRVLDKNGKLVWKRDFPEMLAINDLQFKRLVDIADLDGDGHNEVLFAPIGGPGQTDNLNCYGSDGKPLWTYPADNWLSGGPAVAGAYGILGGVGVVTDGTRRFVSLLTCQRTEALSRVVLLDAATGRVVDEYWHPGRLYAYLKTNLDDDPGDELVLRGYNNPRDLGHPAVVVLDVPFDNPTENPHAAENFYGAWNAKEKDYILFPRIPSLFVNREKTCVSAAYLENDMIVFEVSGNREGVHSFYYFDDKLEKLLRYRPADTLLGYHRMLCNQGILQTDATPEEIKRWARCGHFPTAPDGDDPEVARVVETSPEVAESVHTGKTPPWPPTRH